MFSAWPRAARGGGDFFARKFARPWHRVSRSCSLLISGWHAALCQTSKRAARALVQVRASSGLESSCARLERPAVSWEMGRGGWCVPLLAWRDPAATRARHHFEELGTAGDRQAVEWRGWRLEGAGWRIGGRRSAATIN